MANHYGLFKNYKCKRWVFSYGINWAIILARVPKFDCFYEDYHKRQHNFSRNPNILKIGLTQPKKPSKKKNTNKR